MGRIGLSLAFSDSFVNAVSFRVFFEVFFLGIFESFHIRHCKSNVDYLLGLTLTLLLSLE